MEPSMVARTGCVPPCPLQNCDPPVYGAKDDIQMLIQIARLTTDDAKSNAILRKRLRALMKQWMKSVSTTTTAAK